MARLCERPGCSQPADVSYGIDADHLTVWIESFDRSQTMRAGVLCRRHADAMVVPLGWMLDDRREPVPRLFKSPAVETPARPKRQRVAHPRTAAEQLELDEPDADRDSDADADVDVNAADGAAAADRTAEAPGADAAEGPWKPVFDQTDDLDGLLHADSPLLARAFRSGARPRSN